MASFLHRREKTFTKAWIVLEMLSRTLGHGTGGDREGEGGEMLAFYCSALKKREKSVTCKFCFSYESTNSF